MSDSVQYVTNAEGKKVGLLLDLETYQQLTNLSVDSELLIGLNLDELQALAASYLSPKAQIQLHELLVKNSENDLSHDETETLDRFLAEIDQLNILKTRARYSLNKYLENWESY
ncbi:hypothetical protein LC605_23790 [Nostoc sp. CHAB 5836]|uniref:hypothetical protein n=1 Tax=Nostoc sp. CHAB 5836 TaxID=2780404 RepID=UPI001E629772|nr:hypothetical protein [Nostoc sp. CHAB 5836]MCC5618050.1 hypothetical protein [Nostoc sp. CHAB 5836]